MGFGLLGMSRVHAQRDENRHEGDNEHVVESPRRGVIIRTWIEHNIKLIVTVLLIMIYFVAGTCFFVYLEDVGLGVGPALLSSSSVLPFHTPSPSPIPILPTTQLSGAF